MSTQPAGPVFSLSSRSTIRDLLLGRRKNLIPLSIDGVVDPATNQPVGLYIKPPSAGAMIAFLARPDTERISGMLDMISVCVVDENCKPIFANEDEVAELAQMDMPIFAQLSSAITALATTAAPSATSDTVGKGGDLPLASSLPTLVPSPRAGSDSPSV